MNEHPGFDAFVLAHGPELVGVARRLTMDHHRGEDIVQDVLARIALSWDKLSHVEDMRAYVLKAVLRDFLSWRRRLSSNERPTVLTPDDGPVGPGADDGLAARDEARRALARLKPVQRAVLVLRYHHDRPDAEIAELLGCRESTVRSHARRALAELRAAGGTADRLAEGTPR